jgi:hypothetical protein
MLAPMGIEWLAESLREAREVHITELRPRFGRQTEGHSGFVKAPTDANGSSDRWIDVLVDKAPPLVWASKLIGR